MTSPQDPYNNGGYNTGGNQGHDPYSTPSGGATPNPGSYPTHDATGYQGDNYQGGYAPGGWETGQKNTMAAWALGISIAAVVLMITFVLAILAPLLGLVGLILGIIGVVNARKITGAGRRMGMSVVSIVLSALAIIIPVIMVIVLGVFGLAIWEEAGLEECMNLSSSTAQEECLNDKLMVEDLETP